jgi:hypothetical protein
MKAAATGTATTAAVMPVRHLRAQGAYLYKRSTHQHLTFVSVQDDVDEIPDDRVNEAFGVENWPHLLHMLGEGDITLKRRVLSAMAEVFKLPKDLAMCIKHGVLALIEQGVLDVEPEIAELSARVLSVMMEASVGRAAFMESEFAIHMLPVFAAAAHHRTAQHLYDALLSVARSFLGAQLLTQSGYLVVIVDHLKRSSFRGELRVRSLQLFKRVVNDGNEVTAIKAIDLTGVELCAHHVYDANAALRVAACDAIAALACVDRAKKIAVDHGVVKKLCTLLTDAQWHVAAASAGALMNLGVHDDAKRQVVASDALSNINQLLQSPKYLLQLNAVKLVTVLASYPPARRQLNVASTEYHLRVLAGDADALLAKSARLALHAVQWQP